MAATTAPEQMRRPFYGWLLHDGFVVTQRNLIATTRVPEVLFFSLVQPVIFVLLFAYVYGGAIPIPSHDRPITARLNEHPERKTALARAGAALVQPGELVFLDSGSTHVTMIDHLPEDADITIATNGVDVAAAALRP